MSRLKCLSETNELCERQKRRPPEPDLQLPLRLLRSENLCCVPFAYDGGGAPTGRLFSPPQLARSALRRKYRGPRQLETESSQRSRVVLLPLIDRGGKLIHS